MIRIKPETPAKKSKIGVTHAPYAFTRKVTPALYGEKAVTKSALPKPPRRAKVPKVNRGGRPKKANALTPAQKQAAYRARLKEAKA